MTSGSGTSTSTFLIKIWVGVKGAGHKSHSIMDNVDKNSILSLSELREYISSNVKLAVTATLFKYNFLFTSRSPK